MAYRAEVVADSVSPDRQRITTIEVEMPRVLLSEYNTYRTSSRNSASSRAIPAHKQIRRVIEDPYNPSVWTLDERGMQGYKTLEDEQDILAAEANVGMLRDINVLGVIALMGGSDQLLIDSQQEQFTGDALEDAQDLKKTVDELAEDYGIQFTDMSERLHKQVTNRYLEPWIWHTVVTTATEWNNFYALRRDSAAEPHIQMVSEAMVKAHSASEPEFRDYDDWHLPYVTQEDRDSYDIDDLLKVSVARCARVSYENHRKYGSIENDTRFYDVLTSNGHASPLAHPSRPMNPEELEQSQFNGNFRGGGSIAPISKIQIISSCFQGLTHTSLKTIKN